MVPSVNPLSVGESERDDREGWEEDGGWDGGRGGRRECVSSPAAAG